VIWKLSYFFEYFKSKIPFSVNRRAPIIDLNQVFPLLGYEANQIIMIKFYTKYN
jgi:hypothetical protein